MPYRKVGGFSDRLCSSVSQVTSHGLPSSDGEVLGRREDDPASSGHQSAHPPQAVLTKLFHQPVRGARRRKFDTVYAMP